MRIIDGSTLVADETVSKSSFFACGVDTDDPSISGDFLKITTATAREIAMKVNIPIMNEDFLQRLALFLFAVVTDRCGIITFTVWEG